MNTDRVDSTAERACTDIGSAATLSLPADRLIGWVLAIGGATGTGAALALLLDRISLLQNPAFVPACTIDPILSCASIMNSWQAEVLGFPNPIIGVLAFPVVATIGVVTLTGAELPRWTWLGLQLGATLAVGFVHWLISQSLFVIGALCLWCVTVWVVTITVFWYVTIHTLTAGRSMTRGVELSAPVRWSAAYHGAVLAGWLAVVAALVVIRFWSPWSGWFQ